MSTLEDAQGKDLGESWCVTCGIRLLVGEQLRCAGCQDAYLETVEWAERCDQMQKELEVANEQQK